MFRRISMPLLGIGVLFAGLALGRLYAASPIGTYCNTGAFSPCPSGVTCSYGVAFTCRTDGSGAAATCFETLAPVFCQNNYSCNGATTDDGTYCTCTLPYPRC